MKKLILFCIILLGAFTLAEAQVTQLNYLIEYNETTTQYDCKIVITSGEAIWYPRRIQFNAQYSIIVPTGADFSIAENHNPLESNQDYEGTIPCQWEIGSSEIAPSNYPNNDFHAIIPNLEKTLSYNNLTAGDTITLFSLAVDVEPCENSVRIVNDEEPIPYFPDPGADYSNGFTIGGINQLYSGNLYTPYGIIKSSEPIQLCPGSSTTIDTDLEGVFTSDNPEIAVVDEVTGLVSAISGGVSTITFVDDHTGCQSNLEVIVNEIPVVNFTGSNEICINESTSVFNAGEGIWFSSDPSIATVDNSGNIIGLGSGTATLTFSNNETGCISVPLILTVLPESDPTCIVGIEELTDFGLKIYPNPTSNWLFVEAERPIQSISIYTVDFKKVDEVLFSKNTYEASLSLSILNQGFYFLGIKSNGKAFYKKLRVQ